MPDEFKKLQFEISRGSETRFVEVSDNDDRPTPDAKTIENARRAGETMVAYRKDIKRLLDGPFSAIRDFVPQHLSLPGLLVVVWCTDGLLLRFDPPAEEPRVLVTILDSTITDAALKLSGGLVRLHDSPDFEAEPADGVELSLTTTRPGSSTETTIVTVRIAFDGVLAEPETRPLPPQRPHRVLSVGNRIGLELHGALLSETDPAGPHTPMAVLSDIELPLGWTQIEVYAFFDPEHWKPESAALWAERDLLAAATAHHLLENRVRQLDPREAARAEYESLLREFKALLDSEPEREETLQSFLKEHPILLCPSFSRMWPKLSFGNRVTDFVFRDATGDYLLVEIERSTLELFKLDGDTRAELNHAFGQVTDWRRYIEDNLSTVQRELGMEGISSQPRALIVMGRSKSLSDANRRTLRTLANERPKTRFLTYDDVLEEAKTLGENLFGPLNLGASGSGRVIYPNRPLDELIS